jgi:hypothetical protein
MFWRRISRAGIEMKGSHTADIMTILIENPTDWNEVNQNATSRPHVCDLGA